MAPVSILILCVTLMMIPKIQAAPNSPPEPVSSSEEEERIFAIDVIPVDAGEVDNINEGTSQCDPGFTMECTKMRCRKPQSSRLFNKNEGCSKTCPQGKTCQCTKLDCVPVTGPIDSKPLS